MKTVICLLVLTVAVVAQPSQSGYVPPVESFFASLRSQVSSVSVAVEPGFGRGAGESMSAAMAFRTPLGGWQTTVRVGHSLNGSGGVVLLGLTTPIGQFKAGARAWTVSADVQAGPTFSPAVRRVILGGLSVSTPVRGKYSAGAGVHLNSVAGVGIYSSIYATIARSF